VLAKLKALFLNNTQVSDVGCAALAAVLDNRARCRHSLDILDLSGIPASAAAMGPPRRWR
jgi:ABC-type transporter Mla MlaB component